MQKTTPKDIKSALELFMTKEVFDIIERARKNAATRAIYNGCCIKDTNFIAEKTAILLLGGKRSSTPDKFFSLCLSGLKPFYRKMSRKGLLPQDINTFEEFNARFAYFIHELNNELKSPLTHLERCLKKMEESFCVSK